MPRLDSEQKNNYHNNKQKYHKGYSGNRKYPNTNKSVNNSVPSNTQELINNDISYCTEFLKSYNSQSFSGQNYLLSPQLLNETLKNINMDGYGFSTEQIRKMVMSPHNFEQELRKLSYFYYNYISIYKRNIEYKSTVLDFDWEPTPYTLDGKPITQTDITSNAFKRDYAEMTKFFNNFNVKQEFGRVLFNILLYDTYYTLYTFLYILHKKTFISAICAMVYKVTTIPKHLLMGENCVISASMHFVFQSERYTNKNVILFYEGESVSHSSLWLLTSHV